jgi:triacylglycerol lipase
MSFDRNMAIDGAELIQALYLNDLAPTINESRTDTQVLVRRQAGYTFVVFPGTASFRDGLTDIKFRKVAWPVGKVHRGFRAAFESIRGELGRQIGAVNRIILCGHSLGGALATLAAHSWETLYPGVIQAVYTFGSPRVGNGAFARSYNAALHDETFRVVNQDDPVVRVPWLLGTYRHVGTRVFLDDAGHLEVNPPLWRGVIPSDLLETREVKQFVKLSAHSLASYLKKLKA